MWEQQRLERLAPPLADRFLRCRTYLKAVLVQYLQITPPEVAIKYTANGKPFITGHSIHFNLSHSGNLLVVAVSKYSPVGIDLEQIKPRSSFYLMRIIKRYFSLEEQRCLENKDNLLDLFYRSWVCEEAYTKFLDIPLQEGLKQCNVISLLEERINSYLFGWVKRSG